MDDANDFSVEGYLDKKKRSEELEKQTLKEEEAGIRSMEKEHSRLEEEALESTRNALKTARETEDVGKQTLGQLGVQGDRLGKTHGKMEEVDTNAEKNYLEAKNIKRYDSPFGIPFGFFSTKKKQAVDDAYAREKHQIEERQKEVEHKKEETDEIEKELEDKKSETGEASPKNAELQEIDQNLDEIDDTVKNLKVMGLRMNDEMDRQKNVVKTIDATRAHTEETLKRADEKIRKFTV